jgi:hypothetical protein
MKTLRYVFIVLVLSGSALYAQEPYPLIADSLTRGLWHFDEAGGTTAHDASMYHNDGTASGTNVVEGPFGSARSFNGAGDYVSVPSDSSLSVGAADFVLDAWFKTTSEEGIIVRRGIAPVPGYNLMVHYGYVYGEVGANVDPGSPDPLISAHSTRKYNDGFWHHARLIRDREALTLSLYVDDTLAAPPTYDNLTVPLVSDRPLTIGRWENTTYPQYFQGTIDEVRLRCSVPLRRSLQIQAAPSALDFGAVRVGSTGTETLTITNAGFRDTLMMDSVLSSTQRIVPSLTHCALAPGESRRIDITFSPTMAGQDTGRLVLMSNDPLFPTVSVFCFGRGIVLMQSPMIDTMWIDPYTYSQAHLVWFRSTEDSSGASDPVTQYTVWGRYNPDISSTIAVPQQVQATTDGTLNAPWLYLSSVPAVGFDVYAVNVSHPYTSISSAYWNVCVVVALTAGHQSYVSTPDTLSPYSGLTAVNPHTPGEPSIFQLSQNYPNPFNPSTIIRGQWSRDGWVTLAVYDVLGRKVAVLADGRYSAGSYAFTFDGSELASGVYFYRLTADEKVVTRKMMLQK